MSWKIAVLKTISRFVPSGGMPLFGLVETAAAALQGKGWGSATIAEEVELAIAFLPKLGAIVVDAGANRGDWSRAMLARCGSRVTRLYAFEPSSYHANSLQHISDSRFEWIPEGLNDTATIATLFAPAAGDGMASIFERRLDHKGIEIGYREQITLRSLEEFAAERDLHQIDFLKLDVEGNELRVLRGARKLLINHNVRALAFEFGGCNVDARVFFRDMWRFLADECGYCLFRIAPPARLVPVLRYEETLEFFRTTNYIAAVPRLAAAAGQSRP